MGTDTWEVGRKERKARNYVNTVLMYEIWFFLKQGIIAISSIPLALAVTTAMYHIYFSYTFKVTCCFRDELCTFGKVTTSYTTVKYHS